MRYLVDANVLSEATRPEPNPKVLAWLAAKERSLVVDPIVLGELRYGILLLAHGARRGRLEEWFEQGAGRMECVPFDARVGRRWAELLAELRRAGRPMSIKDSLIAATALSHGLSVATLNPRDFEPAAVSLVDPSA